MSYQIIKRYIPINTKRRSGRKLNRVRFIVSHDTGNPNSTANGNVNYLIYSAKEISASAHVFIDDKNIIECIPLDEKAWHVLYDRPKDNELFGCDANDCAIGVELCYGTNINMTEAYKRYLWYIAKLCIDYNLSPTTDVVGHFILDPGRKVDPMSALGHMGKSYDDFLFDLTYKYLELLGDDDMLKVNFLGKEVELEKVIVKDNLNHVSIRELCEKVGFDVEWDVKNEVVNIKLK